MAQRTIKEIDGQFKMSKEEKLEIKRLRKIKDQTMTNEERINGLKGLMAKGTVQSTGDQLFLIREQVGKDPMAIPVALFLRHKEDESKVWLCSTAGVFLFECTEFYEYCLESAKNTTLENLDKMLKQETARSLMKGI